MTKSLDDFSPVSSKSSENFLITPTNIAFLSELLRYAASSKVELDENLLFLLKVALEILFPSEWSDSDKQKSQIHPFEMSGFQNND